MSIGFYLVVGILLVGVIFVTIVSRRKGPVMHHADGIPFDKDELYQLAMNPGADGKLLLYSLTTCNNCVRAHDFLNKHEIEHNYIMVDHFTGQARTDVVAKIRSYNPRTSFPTMVFPDGKVVVGFRDAALRETLGLES